MNRFSLILIILFILGASAWAVPQMLEVQGAVNPLPPEGAEMQFVIYDAATGGSVIWESTLRTVAHSGTQTETNVVLGERGEFRVVLGEDFRAKPVEHDFVDASYLQVLIHEGGETEDLWPRSEVASALYAINSRNVIGDGTINIAPASGTAIQSTSTQDHAVYAENFSASEPAVLANMTSGKAVSIEQGKIKITPARDVAASYVVGAERSVLVDKPVGTIKMVVGPDYISPSVGTVFQNETPLYIKAYPYPASHSMILLTLEWDRTSYVEHYYVTEQTPYGWKVAVGHPNASGLSVADRTVRIHYMILN